MLNVFCAPARYVQGRNATDILGAEMQKLGLAGPAFIVASKSARTHLNESWRKTFAEVLIEFTVHDSVGNAVRRKSSFAKTRH